MPVDSINTNSFARKQNIFATKDWQSYDYQADIKRDLALQAVKPVGKEVIK